MITSLSIENFALIDKLSIGFNSGFSIITGETGAGKSILLGALGLALGNRADLSSLKDKNRKCIIEAVFSISDYGIGHFFDEAALDYEDETIVRREILPSGKSRAFVNDTPVNLQQLQLLGNLLIDIHSQHETRELNDEAYQFRILDAVAGNAPILDEYRRELKDYKFARRELAELNERLSANQKEQDYNNFLLDELLAANLRSGEVAELEAEHLMLSNVGIISENFQKAMALASDETVGVRQNLNEFRQTLQKLSSISDDYKALAKRAESVLVEFDDIVSEVENMADKLSADPDRLEFVNNRLQMLSALMKKHQAVSEDELITVRNELDEKIVSASEIAQKIEAMTSGLTQRETELNRIAHRIRTSRESAAPGLVAEITGILGKLGMPHVRIKIDLKESAQFLPNGKDELAFLFAANKGSDFGQLKKVASGGEMSRIMLAVKSILAKYQKLPTIIFDEIDTGVSGEIADSMGEIMKSMSETMQVFSITHLPQIAAKGSSHYKVFKSVEADRTHSSIVMLSHSERIGEIAKMLSGSTVSESAINHARALLD